MKKIRAFFKNVQPIYLFLILFGLLFVVIGLVIAVPTLNENKKLDKIAKTGTSAVAYNLQMVDSGVTINDVKYYYLVFDYDAGLRTKEGKTSASFTEEEARQIVKAGTLNIKYTYEGTVEENFDIKKADKKVSVILIICLIAGGAVTAIGLIRIIVKTKADVSISKYGVETKAYDVTYKLAETINDVKYYRLFASYNNERGEYVEGKSKNTYTLEQAERLAGDKNVLIKYYGKSFEVTDKGQPAKEENR